MNVAFLCLGGNIGDRLENIAASKKAIEDVCGKIQLSSQVYETEAWGSNSTNNYLNQVIKIKTKLDVNELLSQLLVIEKKLGRKRDGLRNSDRTIDIDILLYNSIVLSNKHLKIPHPRIHERNFVLVPLNEIAGKVKHPTLKTSISSLLKNSKDPLTVKPYVVSKPPKYICIEGNIGSGKSTIAKALAKYHSAYFLPEEFADNALLPLFYENKQLFAFPLEYSFLLNRFNQLQKIIKSEKKIIISDYSFYKCLWFAKINLTKKDFALFKKQFNVILNKLPRPDVIVFLDTSISNLTQNIKKRGRDYEQTIAANYLKHISTQYTKGLNNLKDIKQLHLKIENYDGELERKLLKQINNFIKDNFDK